MNDLKKFDWNEFEQTAIDRLKNGDELAGENGVLTPLIQRLLTASLDGELQAHLDKSRPNRRNGSNPKKVKTSHGLLHIDMPRDRDASFDSAILPKRESSLGQGLDNKILALYGLGMSYSDIRSHLAEMYGLSVSEAALTTITDKVLGELEQWQARQLDPVYPFVWLDAIHYKVRHEGRVVSRALYTVLAVTMEGKKELLGLYVSHSEGARFWLGVLSDLKERGCNDMIIASIDGLKGFPEAIETIYPQVDIQLCLVHQMRNSLRFVLEKDRKAVIKDLKSIYQAPKVEAAQARFEEFKQNWGEAYPMVVKSWQDNWTYLTKIFDYPGSIRRIMYTTNPVEAVHRQFRKVTKSKGAFVSDQALTKLIYLVYRNISKKWTGVRHNWAQTLQQLYILYPERLPPIEEIAR